MKICLFCQNQIKTYLQEAEKAAQKRDREGNLLEANPQSNTEFLSRENANYM